MTSSQPSPSEDESENDEAVVLPPAVVEHADNGQLQHFVTTIKTAEQQVGENIISALQHDGTVAVLTTVVIGPDGQQRVVTAALDSDVMTDVQKLLTKAAEERVDEKKCVGFHCLIKRKESADETAATSADDN